MQHRIQFCAALILKKWASFLLCIFKTCICCISDNNNAPICIIMADSQ